MCGRSCFLANEVIMKIANRFPIRNPFSDKVSAKIDLNLNSRTHEDNSFPTTEYAFKESVSPSTGDCEVAYHEPSNGIGVESLSNVTKDLYSLYIWHVSP